MRCKPIAIVADKVVYMASRVWFVMDYTTLARSPDFGQLACSLLNARIFLACRLIVQGGKVAYILQWQICQS